MDLSKTLIAIAEPTRLKAIQIVWVGGEHCVCELMDQLNTSQSRMSRHMKVLREAGLVLDRRDAQWVRYRRNPDLPRSVQRMIDAIMVAADANEKMAA